MTIKVDPLGFGVGDFAQNLMYSAVGMYLLLFYTDVVGMSAASAAMVFLVAQIVDFIWNPIVGAFIDRCNPPWGKYRTYLLAAGIPFVALAVLCFANPFGAAGGTWKLVYAYATFIGISMLFTVVNVAYGALGASLTRNTDEITVLTAVRIFLANAGCFVASAGVPVLVAVLAGQKELPWSMSFFMGLVIFPSFIFMPMLPALKRRLGKKGLFFVFGPVAVAGMAALYVLSRLGPIGEHSGLVYAAQFVKASGIIVATGYMWALVPEVISYSEHRTGMRMSGIVNALMGISFRLGMAVGRVVPGMVLAWTGYRASSDQAGPVLPTDPGAWLWTMVVFALIASAALVYCFMRTKERVVMDSETSAKVKIGDLWREFRGNGPLRTLALFFIVAFAMMSVGNAAGAYFMNGLETQTPLAQEGVRWLVCVIPAILLCVATVVMARYPLTDELVDKINHEIESGAPA